MHKLFFFIFVFTCKLLFGQSIFVDHLLMEDCYGNYSIENRDCSGSDGDAYKRFNSVSSVVVAGDEIMIRAGVYNEQIEPMNSGTLDNYIIYSNYKDETVEVSGTDLNPAILIYQESYIVFDGLNIINVRRWLNGLGADHIIIRNCKFENSLDEWGSSKTGLFFQDCSQIKIVNNTINNSTQDNIGMINCNYNLIENNKILNAQHALWALKCSSYNIIRNNYFHNSLQKIGEIYDCENAGYGSATFPKLDIEDQSKYNVVENNIFAYTPSPEDKSPYAGIQLAAQHTIIRNNIFYNCEGPPIDLTLYADEAKYNYGNRIYNNVFFNNEFGGLHVSGRDNYQFYDQIFKNNIFYKNKFVQKDFRWDWYEELDNKSVQIITGREDEVLFENNNIYHSEENELYLIAFGDRTKSNNADPQSLQWWQTERADMFRNNLAANPEFVDESNYDFHLQSNSKMIDAGTFLSSTKNVGNQSKEMEVDDVTWFTDGHQLSNGDTIQLQGQLEQSAIIAIDYDTRILTLDNPLTWEEGEKISMQYNNDGPDIGAFELEQIGVSTDELKEINKALMIVPNPAQDDTEIIYNGFTGKPYTLYCFDINGHQVLEKRNINKPSIIIDIRTFNNGVYFVRIVEEDIIKAQDYIIVQ